MNDDINAKSIGYWFLAISAMLVVAGIVCAGVVLGMNWANRRFLDKAPSPLAPAQRVPTGPRLQANPAADMARMREQENAVLTSYGWIDQAEGTVRIPIERAIELVAKESK